jgi:hypothetical protein
MQRRGEQFETPKLPPGFGLRQPTGAFGSRSIFESGRGLPQSKTLRVCPCATQKLCVSAPLRLCVEI